MKETKIIRAPDDSSLQIAAQTILDGGLVVFPTETVYGLGANALDAEASKKIYEAKGRPSDNPLIIHLPSVADVEKYCMPPKFYYTLAEKFLPGALTVILPKRPMIPDTVTAGLDTVAVRIPSNPIANRLLSLCGVPVAAPSANLSGKPSPTTLKHVLDDMNGRADVIIDGGESEIGLESTIIKLEGENGDRAVLLRPGEITLDDLRGVCSEVIIGDSVTGKFEGKPIAPGMKYRHYAPDAPVFLIDGDDAEFSGYVEEKIGEYAKTGKKVGILRYDEDDELAGLENSISLGKKDDSAAQAHRLFECLRDFKDVDVIYGRLPSKAGIGLAVYNRLIKAAGFQIIDLRRK